MTLSLFDLFKVGIGPSSSHTVGPMKAARRFVQECGSQLLTFSSVRVELFGSLALTGEGHGTMMAIMMGLEGYAPEDVNRNDVDQVVGRIEREQTILIRGEALIPFSPERDIVMEKTKRFSYHTNGMRFTAFRHAEVVTQKIYYSIGGGFVVAHEEIGIPVLDESFPSVLMFSTGEELLQLCDIQQKSIAEIMWARELHFRSMEEIERGVAQLSKVMHESVHRGIHERGVLPGKLSLPRRAAELYEQLSLSPSSDDPAVLLDWVSLFAIAVNEENASFGKIVTAPTNGAAGIIPAVLHYYERFTPQYKDEGVLDYFLVAAAIGILYKEKASISGAEVGCQGEVGVASSMAAAGLCAVLGGSDRQIANAAEIAMEHHLGLPCDPIAGLVQIPCIERNAMGAIKAINAARMALSRKDGQQYVTLDEVIRTMYQLGQDMDEKYKETSTGGLAQHVRLKEGVYSVPKC